MLDLIALGTSSGALKKLDNLKLLIITDTCKYESSYNSVGERRMQVEIYSKDNCPYCVRALALVEKYKTENTVLVVYKVETDGVKEELLKRFEQNKLGVPKTVPQIFVDNFYVGGYDQFSQYVMENDL